MFYFLKKLSSKLEPLDNITHNSKLSLLSMLFILAAIPVTVIAAVSYRSFASQAATGKPDQLRPVGLTNNSQPTFSWSCYCYTTRYRVYLRINDNQFWSNNYWYKDVAGTTADYAGWKKNGSYPDFPGFRDAVYFWTVGCTPGYGGCNNADIVSFTVDTTPPKIPTGLTSGSVSFGSVTLVWDPMTEKNLSYEVYRSQRVSLDTGFSQNTWACASLVTSCTDTLFEGTLFTYYYVRARDAAGNTSGFSQPFVTYVPNNDLDRDGFFDSDERYLGTNVRNSCGGNNSWPPDLNGDGQVTIADQMLEGAKFGTKELRYDFNKDGIVTSADSGILATYLDKRC